MTSRRRKKPPDLLLSPLQSTSTLRSALTLDFPSRPLRPMLSYCNLNTQVWLCHDFTQISIWLTIVEGYAHAFGVWEAPRVTLDGKLSVGHCSSAWRLSIGTDSGRFGTKTTVRGGVSFQRPHFLRLKPGRNGKVALRFFPASPSAKVLYALTLSSQPPSWRPYSQNHLAQHVTMLWLDSWFFDQPLFGGWTVLCILFFHGSACFLAEKLMYNFVYPWSRTSSYFLLSLSRACRYAQQYVYLYMCCCWHLDPMLRLRDEVKVECLFVYDEYFSETESSCLMPCLFPPYCCYCPAHHQITRCHEHITELWIPMDFLESVKPALKAAAAVSLKGYLD